ncbi:MAG: DNA-3-methyladenine glycosylase I [Methanomassiliicoccales archaeon]|nr:DNA-3-methyladenine glycosylase I [Methanomassiliicoccales archaeon]
MEGNEMLEDERRRPPSWMYREESPPSEDSYFENMARVIFLAGFSWKVINDRWPEFRKAFNNFSLKKIALFGPDDEKRLLSNPKIIRNKAKIEATIENARRIIEIQREYGSFKNYINSLDKRDNYSEAIKDISKRFIRMGPSSSRIFLYSIGEDIHRPQEMSRD